MRAIAIIPARLAASRFPNKPLATILGMPMIGHCYFRTHMCRELEATYVATCDEEIATYVRSIDGKAIMTASTHNRASDRAAEAMTKIETASGRVDVVVMVQGDEPLLQPQMITDVLHPFSDPDVQISNIVARIRTPEDFVDKNNVKVVVDHKMNALYMSREPIPSAWKGWADVTPLMQVGIIAFRREALLRFNQLPETTLEKLESVDMNRVLETGGRVRVVLTESKMIGVDTPAELESVARLLEQDALAREYLRG